MKKKEALIRVKVPISSKDNSEESKEIESIESFHVTLITYRDQTKSLFRENKGMDGFKLLGLLTMIRDEITRQLCPSTHNEFKYVKRVARTKDVIEIIEKKND